jgi:hypothetical protein
MRFNEIYLSGNELFNLQKNYSWERNIDIQKENYFCLTNGTTYVILDIDDRICKNILLIKQDQRMLNLYFLAEKLAELPIDTFYFNSERKLGNKYGFITELMGGITIEEDGKYFYVIETKNALARINKRHILKKLNTYKNILAEFNNLFINLFYKIKLMFKLYIEELTIYGIAIGQNYLEKSSIKAENKIIDQFDNDVIYKIIVNDEKYILSTIKNKILNEEFITAIVKRIIEGLFLSIINEVRSYSDDILTNFNSICRLRFNYYSYYVYNCKLWDE